MMSHEEELAVNKPQSRITRRSFLLAATAGTAATAAAIVAKTTPDPAPSADASKKSTAGYQLTEHIRNYYRTARI